MVSDERLQDERQYGCLRPVEVYEDTVYNFAYGSNIYPPDKLKLRATLPMDGVISDGRPAGIRFESFELATLPGWHLKLDMAGVPPVEPSFAAVTPGSPGGAGGYHVGGAIQGALIELQKAQYQKLWASEGGLAGKDSPYVEVVVDVVREKDGQIVRAVVLEGRPKFTYPEDVPTSQRYKTIICQGARRLGVSKEYQSVLDGLPVNPPFRAVLVPKLGSRNLRTMLFVLGVTKRMSWELPKAVCISYMFLLVRVNLWRTRAVRRHVVGELALEFFIFLLMMPGICISFVLDPTFSLLARMGVCDNIMLTMKNMFR